MSKRSRRVSSLLVATVLMAVGVQSVFGHAFRNPPPSSSGLALDGAKSVMVDDVSAVSINPANLTGLEKRAVGISVTFIEANASFTLPNGIGADSRDTLKILPDIFAATPLGDGDIVFGLGITTPYGQSVEWSKGSGLPYFTEMILIDIAPSLALKLTETLSAGAGLDFYQSTLDLRQPATSGMTFDGDGMTAGATLGLTWDCSAKQRLAVVYHSPFDIDYEGDTKISGLPAGIPASSDFETTIKFPTVASVGYSLKLTDTVTVGAEIEWIEFSRFDTLPVDAGIYSNIGMLPIPTEVPQNWDDVWTYGAAASWQCSDTIALRGSYRFLESPIPDSTLSPTLPDADKHTIGVGMGWQGEGQSVDLGYTYTIADDREVTLAENPQLPGTYEIDSHIISLAYSRSL
jgi:long-chain fatty acid transport protein